MAKNTNINVNALVILCLLNFKYYQKTYFDKRGNLSKPKHNTNIDGNITSQYELDEDGNITNEETSFYYLQSRYYCRSWCRFINADLPEYAQQQKDEYVGTNLFAYCANDPVNNVDYTGTTCNLDGGKIIQSFLKKYLINNKKIVSYKNAVVDEYELHCEYVYFMKNKNKKHKFYITFGYRNAWYENKKFLKCLGKKSKTIDYYYSLIKDVMLSSPPTNEEEADKNKATIINSNIAMIYCVINAGISSEKIKKAYKKVWGKNGMDYHDNLNYILIRITNEKGLNGWYVYRYSTTKVIKL